MTACGTQSKKNVELIKQTGNYHYNTSKSIIQVVKWSLEVAPCCYQSRLPLIPIKDIKTQNRQINQTINLSPSIINPEAQALR